MFLGVYSRRQYPFIGLGGRAPRVRLCSFTRAKKIIFLGDKLLFDCNDSNGALSAAAMVSKLACRLLRCQKIFSLKRNEP